MQPLNPFLRAFFRSTLSSQCSPVQHHILLVPTTELLLTSRDRETQALYSDLVSSEEFLASHVVRVPGATAAASTLAKGGGAPSADFRESRSKPKQFTTLNGRTVIVKDTYVYSNKGFKNLNQAQLVSDAIYFPDTVDAQPWLVYYISRPLIGSCETIKIVPASLELKSAVEKPAEIQPKPASSVSRKKEIRSFSDLMNQFPMIARQMQPGLERIFKEFKREVEKPLPPPPLPPSLDSDATPSPKRRRNSISSFTSLSASLHSSLTNGNPNGHYHTSVELSQEEEDIRHSLETAVTAAIDLFQMVDKQQLSLLGSSTDLTGALVERMIERYISEQLHDSCLYSNICTLRRSEDAELEARVRQMGDIDISQVGLSLGTGRTGKKDLALRLSKGVEVFRKMGVAGGPHEMLEILLDTQKTITRTMASTEHINDASKPVSEKSDAIMTINADTLVSLLLIVVIRSPVRHLQARLSYMRHFIFIEDVESGELGYALSTFEAVLSYLAQDSGGLRRSSLRNRKLWQATKVGNVTDMRAVLEPDALDDFIATSDGYHDFGEQRPSSSGTATTENGSLGTTLNGDEYAMYDAMSTENGSLAHVFPFQSPPSPLPALPIEDRSRMKKRVSVQSRSTSSSSGYSVRSLALTVGSRLSAFEGDLSIETLAQTQGTDGDSVLMMAIRNSQDRALRYLLSLTEYFPLSFILEDETNDGTTLLSGAIQTGNRLITDMLLDFIVDHADDDEMVRNYLTRQDENGRSAAHYLFDYPSLIARIGHLIPWRLKDKNGQTPLFGLCRSYDHEEYKWMVEKGIAAAAKAQHDGQRLRLDDHVDNKGNTLLHIVNEPSLANKLLRHCDSDVNASNDRQFTPLMVASKYGRTEMVRTLFGDPRVDLFARDVRGLTATELAKDDEVRNRIDDLVLLATPPTVDRRVTTVVRSYFVEDGTMRFIVKSGAQNPNSTITVTTCRRTLTDFEDLAKWLALEHPASWLPSPTGFVSPFLIPSKPSRSIARDMQLRLDAFLKILLSHSTFATHEMVWEFFLVPDMQPSVLAERSKRKAELRTETIRDEYEPVTDVREVELFVAYAKDSVRSVQAATKSVLRRTNSLRLSQADVHDAMNLAAGAVSTLQFLPDTHVRAVKGYTKCLAQTEFSPLTGFYYSIHSINSTIAAVLASLARPGELATRIAHSRKTVDRAAGSFRRAADRWPRPLGGLTLLDDARQRAQRDAAARMDKALDEAEELGRELRYTQQVVAGELASWQEERVRTGREACKALARRMVVAEKARLEGLVRIMRLVGGSESGTTGKRDVGKGLVGTKDANGKVIGGHRTPDSRSSASLLFGDEDDSPSGAATPSSSSSA